MLIKNKKTKRIIKLLGVLFLIVIIFEIIPRSIDVVASYSNFIYISLFSNENEDEHKKEKFNNMKYYNTILKKRIEKFNFNQESKLSEILNNLDVESQRCKMKIKSIKPDNTVYVDKLKYFKINIELQGNYENFYNYFRYVTKGKYYIMTDKITISKTNETKELNIQWKINYLTSF